jgi:prepilin-type N-terminal cleavage/methylation domain-containing protein
MKCVATLQTCQRGFTVVELVITVVVMGILAVVGVSMISDSFTTARVVNAGQSNANDARYAVERLAREIREIKHFNKATGYDISEMSPSKLVFKRPDDVVVTIDVNNSNIRLNYSSSPGVNSTLATQATLSLQYLALDPLSVTGATSTATGASDLRFVEITVQLTDGTSGKQITERSRVALRNMCETNPCI